MTEPRTSREALTPELIAEVVSTALSKIPYMTTQTRAAMSELEDTLVAALRVTPPASKEMPVPDIRQRIVDRLMGEIVMDQPQAESIADVLATIICPHCGGFSPGDVKSCGACNTAEDAKAAAAMLRQAAAQARELAALREQVKEQERLGIKAECDAAMWKKSAVAKQRLLSEAELVIAAMPAPPPVSVVAPERTWTEATIERITAFCRHELQKPSRDDHDRAVAGKLRYILGLLARRTP